MTPSAHRPVVVCRALGCARGDLCCLSPQPLLTGSNFGPIPKRQLRQLEFLHETGGWHLSEPGHATNVSCLRKCCFKGVETGPAVAMGGSFHWPRGVSVRVPLLPLLGARRAPGQWAGSLFGDGNLELKDCQTLGVGGAVNFQLGY